MFYICNQIYARVNVPLYVHHIKHRTSHERDNLVFLMELLETVI